MIIILTIVVVIAALAFAWWLSGKIMHDEKGSEGETPKIRFTIRHDPPEGFYEGGGIIDQEREYRAPYGGRRI